MSWFDFFTFEKLNLLKKGPIFVGSYATQYQLIQNNISWHQLLRQKWAFPRLSTSVLHKCGHTIDDILQSRFFKFFSILSTDFYWFKVISMTTLVEHRCAQPRECSFLPKKLMSTNIFFIGLVFTCAWYDKNRALF